MDPLPFATLVALVFLFAGVVKGVVGLGLPTVAVGLLSLVVTPAEAASLLILPALLTNMAQAVGPAWRGLLRRFAPMLAAVLPGALAGSFVIAAGNAALPLLGLALLAYAGWGLATPQLRLSPAGERRSALPVGLLGGFASGATGVAVLPVAPWMATIGLPRDALVQALGLYFFVATAALAVGLGLQGLVTPGLAGGSVLAVAPALAGQWLGGRLRGRIPAAAFRRMFFLALLVLGAQLAWRGLA